MALFVGFLAVLNTLLYIKAFNNLIININIFSDFKKLRPTDGQQRPKTAKSRPKTARIGLDISIRIVISSKLKTNQSMKTLTTLTLLLSFFTLRSQSVVLTDSSGSYTATGVIKVDSVKRENLYNTTLEWIAVYYKSAKDVIEFSDRDAGIIIGNVAFNTSLYFKSGKIRYTIKLEFKDGRFRYTCSNFSYFSNGSGTMYFDQKGFISKGSAVKKAEEDIAAWLGDLQAYIRSHKKNDDW